MAHLYADDNLMLHESPQVRQSVLGSGDRCQWLIMFVTAMGVGIMRVSRPPEHNVANAHDKSVVKIYKQVGVKLKLVYIKIYTATALRAKLPRK